ncbi:PEP/pyruvate-binding domain-containing protein [Thermosediminibacter oceani]|uniref:Phosphoenolpyruvate synthase n=1 Tax=Thermosediminibacter oceani (strain ATCC BAA-1034 / DSM 16646 / JW/IW-1228P) TaxID=555079 RepID=D9RZ64_THEOJ|nr:PEP/pyruvate-binding domain-containing protein [Thermosediminibacter oceani]ADL08618.1 pyruvate phosphate dikinase PEP/pyruvate-binding protein [Thermosediminibacter oceani DSM 16646]
MTKQRKDKLKEYIAFDPLQIEGVKRRTLGDGTIGGKAKGFLYSKIILQGKSDEILTNVMFPQSYFIATSVYEEFLEKNGIYKILEESSQDLERTQRAIMEGNFSDYVNDFLKRVLSVMNCPLAIRSSSMLEDSVKYSFAGKYFTTFISNRGSEKERLQKLTDAIKQVYASTFGKNSVVYRKKHGLEDEKMAVIIQELFGKQRGDGFYPEIAGVGFSQNYRRFTERIRKEDGVVRMVFGLGTRSTGRGYARTFSLTNLELRPEGNNAQEIAKYSQETFDMLNLKTGKLESYNINERLDLIPYHRSFNRLCSLYSAAENMIKDIPPVITSLSAGEKLIFTFDRFPAYKPRFFSLMKYLFSVLEDAMGIAVDVEWAYEPEDPRFALIQVRPLSSLEEYRKVRIPEKIKKEDIILAGDRMLTNGMVQGIKYLVYVDHDEFHKSPDKYAIAREVGRVNETLAGERYILVGPGRWGSSNPVQGVPVNYNEICNCGVLIEVGIQRKRFTPELSYGTHFFANLELDGILYIPVFDSIETNIINFDWFRNASRKATGHRAVWIYEGEFDVYLDGDNMKGIILKK